MTEEGIGITGAVARAYNSTMHAEKISRMFGNPPSKENKMPGQTTNEIKRKDQRAKGEANLVRGQAIGHILSATEEFMNASEQEMGVFSQEGPNVAARAATIHDPALNIKHPLRVLRRHMLVDKEDGEVGEYLDAEFNNDIVEMIDGLLDTIVIAWGTVLAYVGPEAAIECAIEVARSNLDKIIVDDLGNETVLKREDGKVMKPEGWVGPDIRGILEKHNIFIPEATNDSFLAIMTKVDPNPSALSVNDNTSIEEN